MIRQNMHLLAISMLILSASFIVASEDLCQTIIKTNIKQLQEQIAQHSLNDCAEQVAALEKQKLLQKLEDLALGVCNISNKKSASYLESSCREALITLLSNNKVKSILLDTTITSPAKEQKV